VEGDSILVTGVSCKLCEGRGEW